MTRKRVLLKEMKKVNKLLTKLKSSLIDKSIPEQKEIIISFFYKNRNKSKHFQIFYKACKKIFSHASNDDPFLKEFIEKTFINPKFIMFDQHIINIPANLNADFCSADEIWVSEESNINMVKLKGKIVRDGNCPLRKNILCEECDYYDGWGMDIKTHEIDIYCTHPNIIDADKLKLNKK